MAPAMLAPSLVKPAPAMRGSRRYAAHQRRMLHQDEAAAINLQAGLVIVGVIIGAVIGIKLLASLMPTWFSASHDISNALANATTGDTTADSLLPVFKMLLALGFVLAIVGIALGVVYIKKNTAK